MPDLEAINKEDDVVVLAVNVREDQTTVEDYMEKHKYEMTVVMDKEGDMASTFFVGSFPTTFFVNEQGTLLGSVPGMLTAEMLDEIIGKIRTGELK